jgi:hypothetical protein
MRLADMTLAGHVGNWLRDDRDPTFVASVILT